MIQLKQKLNLEIAAYTFVCTYQDIKGYKEMKRRELIARWRLDVYEYIVDLNTECINYMLDCMKHDYQVVYLEVLAIAMDIKEENKGKPRKNIGNWFKKEVREMNELSYEQEPISEDKQQS